MDNKQNNTPNIPKVRQEVIIPDTSHGRTNPLPPNTVKPKN